MNIKELRKAAELTQCQLAERLGVNQSTIAAWEAGEKWPRAQMLPALASALGCTVNDLYRNNSSQAIFLQEKTNNSRNTT